MWHDRAAPSLRGPAAGAARQLVALYGSRAGQLLRLDLNALEVSVQDLGIDVVVVGSLTLRQTLIWSRLVGEFVVGNVNRRRTRPSVESVSALSFSHVPPVAGCSP